MRGCPLRRLTRITMRGVADVDHVAANTMCRALAVGAYRLTVFASTPSTWMRAEPRVAPIAAIEANERPVTVATALDTRAEA
jgi:hypothetical protein